MEDQNKVVPQDILDEADRLYPKFDRSDYHTNTKYEYVIYWANHISKEKKASWIAGAMNERAKGWTDEDMLAAFSRMMGFQTLHEGAGKTWLKEYKELKQSKNK